MYKKLNLIFLGNFPYPKGMAGTKRVQHAIDALKSHNNISIRVITQRGSTKHNNASGIEKCVPYHIIMPDIFRIRALLMLPCLWVKTLFTLNKAWERGHINIIYKYGSPSIDDVVSVCLARRLGWQIVYDIVEDDSTATNISASFYHKLTNRVSIFFDKRIFLLADGLITISSHLEKKYNAIVKKKIPVILRPISIDIDKFPKQPFSVRNQIKLFYAGSFGVKDGIPVLLDAFDIVASKFSNIHLVMTGKSGSKEKQNTIDRIAVSPFKDRIEYMGYLDDAAYYHALNDSDIPCMTRVNTGYANAGFPFKLGEYLATGKPVVASIVSDVSRLLENHKEAILVTPGDSTSLATAIDFLVNNPKEAAAIGAKGREKAKKLFDYRTQGELLRKFLFSFHD